MFKIQAATTGIAVKLVGPFDFLLRGKRDEAGALQEITELVVKAHVVALVPNLASPQQPIFRCDDEAYEYPVDDKGQYKKAMASKILATPVASATFRAWAQAVAFQ